MLWFSFDGHFVGTLIVDSKTHNYVHQLKLFISDILCHSLADLHGNKCSMNSNDLIVI